MDNYFLDITHDNTLFAWDFLKTVSSQKDVKGNVLLSPISLSIILSLTSLGAKNNTKYEMLEVLKTNNLEDVVRHTMYTKLLSSLKSKTDSSNKLLTANQIFLQKDYSLLESFAKSSLDYYGAQPKLVDFNGDGKNTRTTINNWVSQNTENVLKDFFKENLDRGTKMVLVNALYLNAKWMSPFKEFNNEKDIFHVSDSEKINVEYMTDTSYFHVGKMDKIGSEIIDIPYKYNEYKMYIILPNISTNIDKVINDLSANELISFTKSEEMIGMQTRLHLPKFKMEESFNAKDILIQMGMKEPFGNSADFSGMTDDPNGFKIDQVLQSVFIDVNEEGTVAAAATAVQMMFGCGFFPDIHDFIINRPFLFYIVHEETDSVIFLGKVMKPTSC